MNPSHPPMSYPACISTLHSLFLPSNLSLPSSPHQDRYPLSTHCMRKAAGSTTYRQREGEETALEVLFPKQCLHMPCSTRLTITHVHCMQLQRKLRERPLYSVFTVMGRVLCAVTLPHNVTVSAQTCTDESN